MSHHEIPVTYRDVPEGHTEGGATFAELQAAGFHGGPAAEHKAGTAPLDEILVDGKQVVDSDAASTILAASSFLVLRDANGGIVATWDEGRWWTPDESAAFTEALVSEMREKGGG